MRMNWLSDWLTGLAMLRINLFSHTTQDDFWCMKWKTKQTVINVICINNKRKFHSFEYSSSSSGSSGSSRIAKKRWNTILLTSRLVSHTQSQSHDSSLLLFGFVSFFSFSLLSFSQWKCTRTVGQSFSIVFFSSCFTDFMQNDGQFRIWKQSLWWW